MDNPSWYPDSRHKNSGQTSRDYPSPLPASSSGHAPAGQASAASASSSASALASASASAPPAAAAASSSGSPYSSSNNIASSNPNNNNNNINSSSSHSSNSYDRQPYQHHTLPHQLHYQLPHQHHQPQHPQQQQLSAHHGSSSSINLNPATSPLATAPVRDNSGDVAMHDAHDAHAGIKYPMRPHHQAHLSGTRSSGLYSPQDQQQHQHQQQLQQQQLQLQQLQNQHQQQPSSAAQRYSPMDTLSPTSPYQKAYTSSPSQQTPPNADYSSSPYFVGRQPQLPPISSYSHDGYPSSAVATLDGSFSDNKAPRRQNPPMMKTVPEFKKIKSPAELQPKNTRQPRFRRANPEGGFISVSLPCHYNLF